MFVPDNWDGISHMEPLHLEFDPSMPRRIKPNPRPIPPKLREATRKEFERMKTYFYLESNSSISSPLVVAPKATAPFIRICGDYRVINKYVKTSTYPIPEVLKEIHKAMPFRVFVDLDVKNAYHQLRLSEETSNILSVQTPWGLYRPKMLPEGVAPGSQELMQVMDKAFRGFEEFMIVIFDNLLVLAMDYEDCAVKLRKVLGRCREWNIHLKLSKCSFGVERVEFFGYVVENGTYRLSDERAQAVTSIPFPSPPLQLKKMQRFLGAANYFKPFIPNYAERAAKLYEMTNKSFDWNETLWRQDYRKAFEDFKESILSSLTLYHPDYSPVDIEERHFGLCGWWGFGPVG